MKLKILAVAAVVALGMLRAPSMADSISATFDSSQPLSENVTAVDPLATTGSENTAAGLWHFTFVAPLPTNSTLADMGLPIGATGFYALCIDFAHNIGYGQSATWNTPVALTSIASNNGNTGNGVGISSHQAAAIGYLFTKYSAAEASIDPSGTQASWAAQLQMAVWDMLYTNTYEGPPVSPNLKRNISFSGSSLVTTDAGYASSLASTAWANTNSAEGTDVFAMTSTSGVQNFTYLVIADNPFISTPLPRTAFAGLSLLAGLAGFGVLRKRQDFALPTA